MGRFQINFMALISDLSESETSALIEGPMLALATEALICGIEDSSRLRISAGMVSSCLFVN